MSESPSTVARSIKAPQDHLPAVQAEAEGVATIIVTYNGSDFTIPADPQDWSVGAIRAFGRGAPLEALPLLLTAGEYDTAGIDSWTGRQANDLLGLLAQASGFGSSGE